MLNGKFIAVVAALVLLSGLVLAQSWTYTITMEPEVGETHDLVMAVTSGASDGYDAFLDIPYFTPPDGKGAFFPLDDPAHPLYTKLYTDARALPEAPYHYYYWVARVEGYYGLDPRYANWDPLALPPVEDSIGVWEIATKDFIETVEDILPGEWVDMRTVDVLAFSAIEDVVVRFTPKYMEDYDPPYVTGFDPTNGEEGVNVAKHINFDVIDARAGVDFSSIVVWLWYDGFDSLQIQDSITWTPILANGFAADLAPPDGVWPESTDIYYSVTACDLFAPPNCMVVESLITFTIKEFYPDTTPPYFMNCNPEPGDENADVDDYIGVIVKDSDTGVDSSTIILVVNSVTIDHADYDITEIAVGSDWFAVTYYPPGSLTHSTLYTIEVTASDNAVVPNIDDTTWTFTTEEEPPVEEFVWDMRVLSIDGTDTAYTNLSIGCDNLGSDLYDVGLDVPQFLFPGEPRGYFPLMDPAHPETPALSTDIRSTVNELKDWVVDVFCPDDNLVLEWDNEALPLTGDRFFFAVVDSGGFPTEYLNVLSYDHADFGPTEVVFIRMLPGEADVDPPVIHSISHEGDDAPPRDPLCFKIVDYGSGVDYSSFVMTVDGFVIDPAFLSVTPISAGYQICYDPPTGWVIGNTYVVTVDVDDNAIPPNNLYYLWSFEVSPDCGPEFDLMLEFAFALGTEGISMGMDEDATDAYDVGYDVIMPPASPGFPGFHFVGIGSPPTDKLVGDVRYTCNIPSIWEVRLGGTAPLDSTTITWDPGAPVLGDPYFTVYYKVQGFADPAPLPPRDDYTAWDSLRGAGSIKYLATLDAVYFAMDLREGHVDSTFVVRGNVTLFGETDHSGAEVHVVYGPVATTDSLGNYELTPVPLGDYDIIFSKDAEGFRPETVSVSCSVADDTVIVDVTLYPGGQPVSGAITICGTPEYGVEVSLWDTVMVFYDSRITTSAGEYYFESVEAGDYTLRLRYMGHATFDTAIAITTSPIIFNYNLCDYFADVCGIALLEGVPVVTGGITLTADGAPWLAVTDTTGAFCDSLTIGLHTICAEYPGYYPACTTLTIPDDGITDLALDITDPEPCVLTINVDLGCESTDESGATVTVTGEGSEITPSSGTVIFDDLSHGWYHYQVEADYHKSEAGSIYVDVDVSENVALCCLDPVTGFTATGDSVERPVVADLAIALSWTEPGTTCCMPDVYEIYRAEVPFIDIAAPGVELIASVDFDSGATYDDITVVDGVTYYYDIRVKYDCESFYSKLYGNETAIFFTYKDEDDILIIDWDNDATPVNGGTMGVGEWWDDMLVSLEVTEGVTMTAYDALSDPLEGHNLDDYKLIIVALGITDGDNAELPAAALAKLDAYRATGGIYGHRLIVEGPDFGEDYTGSAFFDNLDLNFVHAGNADWNVARFCGTRELWDNRDICFEYDSASLADHFVDILAAAPSGFTEKVAEDQDLMPRIFYYNGNCKALVGAIYLGGIIDSLGNTKLRAASGYLNKLGIGNTYILEVDSKLPSEFALVGNRPNPFNPITMIAFNVAVTADVELAIYDITGKRMATLIDMPLKAGTYEASWDASDMPSGIYFARMISGNFHANRKLMLIK